MEPEKLLKPACKSHPGGFSLVEVMIVVGLLGVVALGVASMMSQMSRAQRRLQEQMARVEAANLVSQVVSSSQLCTTMLTKPSAFGFNSAALPATGGLPSGTIPLGAGTALKVGEPASPLSPNLVVQSLDLVGITNAGAPDVWTGEIQVVFDNSKLVMSLAPIRQRIILATDPSSPVGAKKVVSCSGGSGPALGDCRLVLDTWNNDDCSGNHAVNYSDWVKAGKLNWTPYNRNPKDVACMRIGIECK